MDGREKPHPRLASSAREGRSTVEFAGAYRFALLDRITLADGGDIDLWSARDALVLKALAMVLADVLPVSPRCTHVKGHGGAKAVVRHARARLGDNRFVMRTDVKSYYASIGHVLLMDRLALVIPDRAILNLLGQYMKRTSERGGWLSGKQLSPRP